MRIVGAVYFAGVVMTTIALGIAFYRDRKESGIPMTLAVPLVIVGGFFWPGVVAAIVYSLAVLLAEMRRYR